MTTYEKSLQIEISRNIQSSIFQIFHIFSIKEQPYKNLYLLITRKLTVERFTLHKKTRTKTEIISFSSCIFLKLRLIINKSPVYIFSNKYDSASTLHKPLWRSHISAKTLKFLSVLPNSANSDIGISGISICV